MPGSWPIGSRPSSSNNAETHIGTVVERHLTFHQAFGGKIMMDAQRVGRQLVGKGFLAVVESGEEEGIAIGGQDHLTG